MTGTPPRARRLLCLVLAAALAAAAPALAHEYSHGALTIGHPWARVLLQNRPASGYMTIRNAGAGPDALVSASSPLAERVELHVHLMEGAVMKMRKAERMAVPANGEAALAPGGHHLMIIGLKTPLKPGDMLPVTVEFEKAGPVTLEFAVEGMGGSRPGQAHSGHEGHSGHTGHGMTKP